MEILEKKVGLEKTLKNIDKSFKEIKKENIKLKEENTKIKEEYATKEQYKHDLLEKVYPIGSYYWSNENISPENIFGGKWEQIKERFLFSSDSNHSVGSTGGEERHTLSIEEIPSHYHQYDKFNLSPGWFICECNCKQPIKAVLPGIEYKTFYGTDKTKSSCIVSSNTDSRGSSSSHNNMPPYLTANCWKRIG